jgi:hypothetical protein
MATNNRSQRTARRAAAEPERDTWARIRSSCDEPPHLVGPILQRLGEPHRTDALLAREVRNRARHAQRPMHGARRHAAAVHWARVMENGHRLAKLTSADHGGHDRDKVAGEPLKQPR